MRRFLFREIKLIRVIPDNMGEFGNASTMAHHDLEPKESVFRRWFPWFPKWSPSSPAKLREAEEKFLSYCPTKSDGRYVNAGTINGTPCRIWTRQFGDLNHAPSDSDTPYPIVLVHGMGAGIAYFVKNVGPLAKTRPVYAIDLPGFARSSRPKFSSKPEEVEVEYVRSIDNWRKEMGIDKMILLGHSFGGYLSAFYSITYPDHIAHVVLVDPWGFPTRPDNLERRYNVPWWIRGLFQVFKHFNPLASLRLSGPFGVNAISRMRPDLISKYESAFDSFEECAEVVPNYMFHCNAHSPTGESAFHSLMSGFAWAKNPMLPRIKHLDPKVPLTVLYGAQSWMDQISQETFVEVGQRQHNSYTRVKVIDGAGHHVYVEQSEIFNREVLKACQQADEMKKN